jgi:hypothetical protein
MISKSSTVRMYSTSEIALVDHMSSLSRMGIGKLVHEGTEINFVTNGVVWVLRSIFY